MNDFNQNISDFYYKEYIIISFKSCFHVFTEETFLQRIKHDFIKFRKTADSQCRIKNATMQIKMSDELRLTGIKRYTEDVKYGSIIDFSIVDKAIESQISILQEIKEEFQKKLQNEEFVMAQTINPCKICDELIQELEHEHPDLEKETIKTFKERIQNEISAKCEEFNEIIGKIKAKQLQSLKENINSFVTNYEPKIIKYIDETEEIDESEVLRLCSYNTLKKECTKAVQMMSFNDGVYNDILDQVNQYKNERVENIYNKIIEDIKIVCDNNIEKIKKKIKNKVNKIINKEIAELEAKLKNLTLSELTSTNIQELCDSIVETCNQTLQNHYQTPKYKKVLNEFQNKICNNAISKYKNEIRKILNYVKANYKKKENEQIPKVVSKPSGVDEQREMIKQIVDDIISTEVRKETPEIKIRGDSLDIGFIKYAIKLKCMERIKYIKGINDSLINEFDYYITKSLNVMFDKI